MVMVNVNYLIYSQSTLYSLFSIKYIYIYSQSTISKLNMTFNDDGSIFQPLTSTHFNGHQINSLAHMSRAPICIPAFFYGNFLPWGLEERGERGANY